MHVVGVDSEYLFFESHNRFLGSAIFHHDGNDITQLFGVVKHFLVIEHVFEEDAVCLIIGDDVIHEYQISGWLLDTFHKIGIRIIVDKSNDAITVLQSMLDSMSHVITRKKHLLQMVNAQTSVLLPNTAGVLVQYSKDSILREMGVAPQLIPTYMALTDGGKESKLTTRQAQRLITQYGHLEHILAHLPSINDKKVISRLLSNRDALIRSLENKTVSCRPNEEYSTILNSLINQPRRMNSSLLEELGFHSLTRPVVITDTSAIVQREKDSSKNRVYSSISSDDYTKLKELSKKIRKAGLCSVDTESSDKNPHLAELYGISFSMNPGEAFYMPFMDKNVKQADNTRFQRWLKTLLTDENIRFIGHNIKYDYLLLRRHGFKINSVYFDTMLAAHELFGDIASFGLGSLALKCLNLKTKQYKDIVNKDETLIDIPFSKLVNYACEDADITLRLYHWLKAKLVENKIDSQFFKSTMPKVLQFGELEYRGIRIDRQKLTTVRKRVVERMERLTRDVYAACGESFDIEINTETSRALSSHLKLKSYDKNLKESFIGQLAKHHVEARLILEYRKDKSILRKLNQLSRAINRNRVHPLFNLIRSPTGLAEAEKPDLLTSVDKIDMSGVFKPSDFISNKDLVAIVKRISVITGYQDLDRQLKRNHKRFLAVVDNRPDVDIVRLFVHACIGYSNHQIAKEFYVVQRRISDVRSAMREMLTQIFEWFDDFKNEAITKGYAQLDGQKRLVYGLNSSNMAKKETALQNIVRWAIRY